MHPKKTVKKSPTTDSPNPKDLLGLKKPPLGLVPPSAIILESMAMKDGAIKYNSYNWRLKKVIATIYLDACQRHLLSWQDGEEHAADSGVHHLGHARACLGILIDAMTTGNLIDDRPTPGSAAKLIASLTVTNKTVPKKRRKR